MTDSNSQKIISLILTWLIGKISSQDYDEVLVALYFYFEFKKHDHFNTTPEFLEFQRILVQEYMIPATTTCMLFLIIVKIIFCFYCCY